MKQKKREINFTVIAVGGSLIAPHLSDEGGIDVPFLSAFRKVLLEEIKEGRKFVLVAGGGKTARVYRDAATHIGKTTNDDLDWIGIAATKLNAELLRVLFRKAGDSVIVEGGTRPGWSTDYIAMSLAKKFGAKEVIDAGDIDFVYNKDPKKFPDAKPIPKLSWSEYRKLIPLEWTPGMSCPIDPIAARLAQRISIVAKTLKGTDFANLKKAIEGKEFVGTLIV